MDEPAWPGSEHSLGYVTKLVEKWVDRFGNQEKLSHLTREQKIEITIAKLQRNKTAAQETGKTKVANLKTPVPAYEPTPIAELNKRHIPVVYAPEKPTIVRKVAEEKNVLASGASKNIYDFDPLYNPEPSSSARFQKNPPNSTVEENHSFDDNTDDAEPSNSSNISIPLQNSCSSREETHSSSKGPEANSVPFFSPSLEEEIVTNNKHQEAPIVPDNGLKNLKIQSPKASDVCSEVEKCDRNGLPADAETEQYDTKNASSELVDSEPAVLPTKLTPESTKKCDNLQRNEDQALAFLRDLLSGNAEVDGLPEKAVQDTVEDELAKLFCDDEVKEKSIVAVVTSKADVSKENDRKISNIEKPDKRRGKSRSSESDRHRRRVSDDKPTAEETNHSTKTSGSTSKRLESDSKHHESSSKHSSSHHKHRTSSSKEKSKDETRDRHSRESSHRSKSASKTSTSSSKRDKSKESRDNCNTAQAKRKAHEAVDVPLPNKRARPMEVHVDSDTEDHCTYLSTTAR